jgi:hypothetical protein
MPIAIDQTAAKVQKDGSAGTTLAISFSTLPAVGSTVLVAISQWDNAADGITGYSSVVDNQGNGTYSNIQQLHAAGRNVNCFLAYVKANNSSGTFTITYTLTADVTPTQTFITMGAVSFTGLTGALDQSNKTAGGLGVTTLNLTTGATSTANELVVALLGCSASDTNMNLTQNALGYTNLFVEQDAQNHQPILFDYKIVSAIGTQNTDCSHDSATSGNAGIIATFFGPSSSPMFRGS